MGVALRVRVRVPIGAETHLRPSAQHTRKATLYRISVSSQTCSSFTLAQFVRTCRDAAEESSRWRRVVVRRTASDAVAAGRETAAAQRGERARASADARPLQGLLPPQDHAAMGAAGHQAVQAGHPPSRHLLHSAPATPNWSRRRPGNAQRRRRSFHTGQYKLFETLANYLFRCVFLFLICFCFIFFNALEIF